MSPARRLAFALVVAAQAVIPIGIIAANETALASGREITLATVPVDPLDPFRGRYVRLRYEISTLPAPPGTLPGQTVWVPLERRGDRWTGAFLVRERPAGGVAIRGTVREVFAGQAEIEYGIETYFANEDEAPRLERVQGDLLVDVVLDDEGGALIDGVRVGSGS